MSTHNICFLWRNKKNYPIIITKYSSLTSPLIDMGASAGAMHVLNNPQHDTLSCKKQRLRSAVTVQSRPLLLTNFFYSFQYFCQFKSNEPDLTALMQRP